MTRTICVMKHAGIFLWTAVAALAGCDGAVAPDPAATPGAPHPSRIARPITREVKMNLRQYRLLIALRMLSIEAPVGTASESEEIWCYLDEEPVAARNATGLSRNGFRIGLGRRDSWPDVAKLLSHLTGQKLQERSFLFLPGDPLSITLKERQPAQTMFTFRTDRTLAGLDYPPGDNLLTISNTIDEDDPSCIMITGVPQVRSTQRQPKLLTNPGGLRIVNEPVIFSLAALTFQVSVPSGDFLVIGPGIESRRRTSVGHHFLVRNKEGLEFETVLVIIPEVLAAPLPETDAP